MRNDFVCLTHDIVTSHIVADVKQFKILDVTAGIRIDI